MPFLKPDERNTVKETLSEIFNEKELQTQLERLQQKKADGPHSDYTGAMLTQFENILKEAIADKKSTATPRANIAQSPSLDYIKKKYGGR